MSTGILGAQQTSCAKPKSKIKFKTDKRSTTRGGREFHLLLGDDGASF